MKWTGLSGDSLLRSVEDRTQWRKIVHEAVNPRNEEDLTTTIIMKKGLRETQTLRAGCSKADPKIFTPPQTPSRGRRTAKI